jgi:4-hydroxythreonine-4-phosphate dehydrogenase
MNFKPILIVCGEPNSIFSELLVKSFKKYKSTRPIVLIGSLDLVNSQLKKLNLKLNLNLILLKSNYLMNLKKDRINIININYKFKKPFEKNSPKSRNYISKCFNKAFEIMNCNEISGLINGPVSKENFLRGKHQGITEYVCSKFGIKENYAMLIYNKILSVSPITTHLPISKVSKEINTKAIIAKSILITNFYKKNLKKKPKIAITGLNPHCENFFYKSEEKKIINPAIRILKKKKIHITGPFPADTIFLKQNYKNFDVIIGMYHDQVLAPLKALQGFNAINITLGLPFLRVSPDHGPNQKMIGKNKSNPQSLIEAVKFLNKFK